MRNLLINFILDESGSMGSIKDQTISGFNEYVDNLKPKGKSVRFTFTKFNSKGVIVVCNNIPIKDVKELNNETYRPDDLTPLYDAIGQSIKAMEDSFKGKSAENPDVLCVIMTDGQENCSKEYDRKKIFDIIENKKKDGWTFAYLGANQDAWAEGEKAGINGSNTMMFTADSLGVTRGFASTMAATDRYMTNTISHYGTGRSDMIGSSNVSYYADMSSLENDVKKYEEKIQKRAEKNKKNKGEI